MLVVGANLVPLPDLARGDAFAGIYQRRDGHLPRVLGQGLHVIVLPVAFHEGGAEVAATVPEHAGQVGVCSPVSTPRRCLVTKTK